MLLAMVATLVQTHVDWTTLWFDRPVSSEAQWVESLPVGNGRMGAMPFGGVAYERILINEDTVWAKGKLSEQPGGSAAAVKRARELAFAGDMAGAEAAIRGAMSQGEGPSYQPVGWMTVTTRGERRSALPIIDWERLEGREWRRVDMGTDAVAANASATYRARFELDESALAEFDTLTLSPIDDSSVVSLNGKEIGKTSTWDQPATFGVKGAIRLGQNELVVVVTNAGGVGHGPRQVSLNYAAAPDGYRRSLDIAEGISRFEYQRSGGKYSQEVLASHVDDVIVVRLSS